MIFRRVSFRSLAARCSLLLFLAVFAAACSSQKELSQDQTPPGDLTSALMDTLAPTGNGPLLPRPALDFPELPAAIEVNAAEKEPLLDRARLHILLASKTLAAGDTLSAIEQAVQASEKLDRASYLPDIEEDAAYVELSSRLTAVYRNCATTIEESDLDIPVSALALLADENVETEVIDLTALTFKEPPTTTIPLPLNEEVEKNIVYFTTKMRKHFVKWIERSGRYFPVMRPILKEEGMPEEIIYLTMIESGVNPMARSWAACVGLWQFLKSTGEMYGLKGDWYVDDRRDPEKATRAAARHLRDLYNRFNDWHLALAAYNAGAGRISRAIRKTGKDSPTYWDVRPYLPKETQNYVPRFIATAIIALDREEYDFDEVALQTPLRYETVQVNKSYHLKDLAAIVGLTLEDFQTYNPTLLQPITPAAPIALNIPVGRKETFASNIVNCPVRRAEETVIVEHKVKRGESLYKLAKKYHVTVGQIVRANELSSARHLRVGEILRVPRKEVISTGSYAVAMDNLTAKDTERDPTARTNGRLKHVLKIEKGMTLGGIARSFDVTVHDLMNWNSMASEDKLTAGSHIDIWLREDQNLEGSEVAPEEQVLFADAGPTARVEGGKATTREAVRAEATASAAPGEHTVRRGETLASIAETFEVTIENLMDWNNLDDTSIRSGSTLKVQKQEKPAVKKETTAVKKETTAVKAVPPAVKKETPTAKQEKSKGKVEVSNTAAGKSVNELPQEKALDDTVHVVAKGETLFRIARKYGVSVDDVIKWNALPDPGIRIGQKLRIVRSGNAQPVERTPEIVPDASETKNMTATDDQGSAAKEKAEMYTVQAGDNLYSISRAYGVSVEDLRTWNSLKSTAVQTGQKLRVSAEVPTGNSGSAVKAGVKDVPAAAGRVTDTTVVVSGKKIVIARHTVEKGESLNSIARDYEVSVADLRMWNKLAGDQVTIGQQLLVRAGAGVSAAKDAGENVSQPASQQNAAVPDQGEKQEYLVQKGETLYSIARKLNVTVTQLRKWNKIGRFLDIGQKLVYYSGN